MKFLFFVSLLIASSYAIDLPGPLGDLPLPDLKDLNPAKIGELFKKFITEFKKTYANPIEQAKALASFGDNLKKILELNNLSKNKSVEFGINQFTDLTDKEFRERVLMKSPLKFANATLEEPRSKRAVTTAAASVDWRKDKTVVSAIRNQGSCGCCWAFTAAALITGANGIKNKKLVEPSEQQICECALGPGEIGCNGGWTDVGLSYAKTKGVSPVSGYTTYSATRATKPNTCTDSKSPNSIRVAKVVKVNPSTASGIVEAVAAKGPVGVAFAVGPSFRHYKSGIFSSTDCKTTVEGWHAVTAVGYGTENGTPYWIIKNSWGTGFGESGFFRYSRGKNLCYLESTEAYYATA